MLERSTCGSGGNNFCVIINLGVKVEVLSIGKLIFCCSLLRKILSKSLSSENSELRQSVVYRECVANNVLLLGKQFPMKKILSLILGPHFYNAIIVLCTGTNTSVLHYAKSVHLRLLNITINLSPSSTHHVSNTLELTKIFEKL